MMKKGKMKYLVAGEVVLLFVLFVIYYMGNDMANSGDDARFANSSTTENMEDAEVVATEGPTEKYIKWVDFNVNYTALNDAYKADVETYQSDVHIDWIQLLSYLACKNGGNFQKYKTSDLTKVVDQIKNKETTMEELVKGQKYYEYYHDSYEAILGGFVGEYQVETEAEDGKVAKTWETKYGLKAFLPIAKNFPYSDFDDFGVSRSYGYKRKHLGHDMMGQIGTPIVAVESGYVEALGWNQYGGWRIGIRSFDKKRYYYYAHLRQNYPYASNLAVGSTVTAGDVIGYLGRTGYSAKENVNNIDTAHLHFGMQIIFDESQKEGNNEIWIDCYNIVRFLYQNRSETAKVADTKEWKRIQNMKDPIVEKYNNSK
ncbi:MAG: M23 family metallopeptidase [bacterium]|nr:M23 family metallopeptidase [bacterium]